MPVYEYVCKKCGHRFEMYRFFYQHDEDIKCPECGEKGPEKQFSAFSTNSSSCGSSSYG